MVVDSDAPTRVDASVAYHEDANATATMRVARDLSMIGERLVTPRRRGTRQRKMLVVALFWLALLASVSLWWFNTPASAVADRTGIFLAAGRITGLISGFVLLVEFLTMARLRWIESWFGDHELISWHRTLGGALVVLPLTHGVLLVFAYAWAAKYSVVAQAWQMLITMKYMYGAVASVAILLVVGLFSTRFIRSAMPYEMWRLIHTTFYAVLFLAYGHQFALGAAVLRPGLARWYWIGLHLLVLGCLLWGRMLRPIWFNMRHEFRVVDVVHETPGWVSIYIGGRGMEWVHAEAGQFLRCRFLTRRCWWQSHPFSISASPNGEWLRVDVKAVGRYTRALQRLQPGVGVVLSEASGSFTAGRRVTEKALVIAGGSGIAPVMALLGELPSGTKLLYRAFCETDAAVRDELERLARECEAHVFFVVGANSDHWPRRAFAPAGIRELVPDVTERDIYLCGPRQLAKQSLTALRRLGVPRRQIHVESFEF